MASHRAEGQDLRGPHEGSPPPVHGRRRAAPPAHGRRRADARPAAPGWVRGVPRVGVVGVLGLATVFLPLSGEVLTNEPAAAGAVTSRLPPRTVAAPAAVSAFRVVPPDPSGRPDAPPPSIVNDSGRVLDAGQLDALRAQAERATRDYVRSVLPGCDGQVPGPGSVNGRLGAEDLCRLWDPSHQLRADAAVMLARLNVEYENRFGEPVCLTDSYRSYATQARLRRSKPGLAARPGTSEHGWGLAVDLCGGVERVGARYRWLRDVAPGYGWDNPGWARPGGAGPEEPWHWEFAAEHP